MGVVSCKIHGTAQPMAFACVHLVENLRNGRNAKCIEVQMQIVKGKNESLLHGVARVPFCLGCYEDKKMRAKMEIVDDDESIENAFNDYEIKPFCRACINDYVERNRLN